MYKTTPGSLVEGLDLVVPCAPTPVHEDLMQTAVGGNMWLGSDPDKPPAEKTGWTTKNVRKRFPQCFSFFLICFF